MGRLRAIVRALGVLVQVAAAAAPARAAIRFQVTNLVTDDPQANAAQITDANLVNAWGISYGPGGPFWVSAGGSGKSTIYFVDPATNATQRLSPVVSIPGDGSVTGQVFDATAHFDLNAFLFASEDGTVSGWRMGSTATVVQAASTQNVYKGVAIAAIEDDSYLYLANFRAGTIDVLKGSASAPDLSGSFTDPDLPDGYAPFNIANLGDALYVTYAVQDQDKKDDVAGAGHGVVDEFDLQGHLLRRLATGGTLDSPWGLAIAPPSFDTYAGDLLVGNFVDGTINAFDLASASFVGQLLGLDGQPLAIDGLWGLIPGNDGLAGSSDAIYFSAGPAAESHGLFGAITAPEPGGGRLGAAALASLALCARRSRGAQRTRMS